MRYAFLDFLSLSVCIHNMQLCLPSLSLVPAIVSLCPQMEGHQDVSSSTGPPELNRSYYAGNSLPALHSSQQVHEESVSTSVHSRASTQRLIDNTPSCSALGSQLLHGHTGSPVLAGPTRNVTGEAMPTSFVEALTQLSFLEFVQRCNLLVAPPQPPQLPSRVSLMDVAVQTASPCEVFQDTSTQTSDQPGSSLSLDVAVQTIFRSVCSSSLDAAVQTLSHSSPSQDVSTQFGSRPASSFSVVASLQTSTHSVVQLDAATQLDLTEFLIDWIFSDSPLDRRHPLCQSPPSVLGSHVVPLPPPGLEQPVPSPEIADHSQSLTNVSSSSCPTQQPPVSTTHVGTHPVRPAGAKRSASTAHAGTHNSTGSCRRTDAVLFPKPKAVILPMVNFGQPNFSGPSPITTADSDIMHHQFRLSLQQWNPGLARRNPTNIVSAACGRFHAVILQEASDDVPHISDYFRAYTDNTDLAILLNKDTFEPDPFVLSFKVNSTSKNTWGMVLLIVRALLRRPSLSGTPTVTFCLVHIHNVLAEKRDASTELLQFLHAKMLEHNVDFIGGDFNMSAFSTVSDVFSDPEFSAPGHSCLWGLGALDEQHRECTGFLIMPKRPYEWRVDSHGCYKLDNSALGLGPRDQSAHLPVFLHLRNINIPGPV